MGLIQLLPVLLFLCTRSYQLELGQCVQPLGMESEAIKDSAITASSAYDSGSVGPQHGRLRNDKNGGAWCPRQMVSRDAKEFLEIGLDDVHVITASRTQGRFGNGQGQEYAEEYMIEYWRPGFAKWVRWKNRDGKELLSGNTNTYTVVEQKLDPPVIATKIRLLPYSDHVRTVCMRVELVGCKWTDGLLSYSGPQGVKRGPEMDLSDRTYDGREEGGLLSQGLGQLVDGQKGQDNFRGDTGRGKGYEWIGWRNDSLGLNGLPLELIFEFDKVRNFTAAHIHTNNLFTKDVQVFSHSRIYFSIGGNIYDSEPVHFSYMPDLVLEHARNVTIKLHHRVGRFLKVQLYFASRWILLSEVAFDSVVTSGNYTAGVGGGSGEEDFFAVPESEADAGNQYPLQRDEVKTISGKKTATSAATTTTTGSGGGGNPASPGGTNNEEVGASHKSSSSSSSSYIGFVIGTLTVVILILVAAIVFIVFYNQRLKSEPSVQSVVPPGETRYDEDLKLSECDKSGLYDEKLRPGYGRESTHLHSPDYSEVPDVVCQDYSTSHLSRDLTSTSLSLAAARLSFPAKPPPVPPPPTAYYAATSPTNGPQRTSSPPISPSSRTSARRHFMLPLSPESGDRCLDADIELIPHEHLEIIEKLGEGLFVDVHLCKLTNYSVGYDLVVVHTLRMDNYTDEFAKEVRALARLRDPNIAQLLGACLSKRPFCAVREYAEMGDLCQFLQDHVAESATPLNTTANTLSYGCLIYMATQIASGMKCLESMGYIHKDLATRSCLVGPQYSIKISDLGTYRQAYASDYCQIGSSRPIPIRWLAWESVLMGKYSSKSDVWSFAVTLWELLTFAREQPFEELSDEKVIENVTHFYQDNGNHLLLSVPINCPKEIFDLMCECWQRNDSDRPHFKEIHLFLQRKNLGYTPDLH